MHRWHHWAFNPSVSTARALLACALLAAPALTNARAGPIFRLRGHSAQESANGVLTLLSTKLPPSPPNTTITLHRQGAFRGPSAAAPERP